MTHLQYFETALISAKEVYMTPGIAEQFLITWAENVKHGTKSEQQIMHTRKKKCIMILYITNP